MNLSSNVVAAIPYSTDYLSRLRDTYRTWGRSNHNFHSFRQMIPSLFIKWVNSLYNSKGCPGHIYYRPILIPTPILKKKLSTWVKVTPMWLWNLELIQSILSLSQKGIGISGQQHTHFEIRLVNKTLSMSDSRTTI